VHDVNYLSHRLIDVWAGVEQSVIDDVIACIRARRGDFEYLRWQKL